MHRLPAFVLLALIALPAQAQLRAFDDPTVWVSTSVGFLPWTPTAPALGDRDNIVTNFSVNVASPRWMAQAGAQVSGYFNPVFLDPFRSISGEAEESPVSYRTVYAMAGSQSRSRWFMAGAAVGPALTWGRRARALPGDCYDNFCTLIGRSETERYVNPGLAGSVKGFVRLDGRVWLGGETMLVANAASTHLATRFALRVDLLRPDR